ncbi:uncharacterized protein PAC_04656 [Phialocephala subalpina]|uniref:SAP domain-containing protein n=1 Tax=Phialocephala subalpina TaxID=576137 RepID=A0A1L7WPS1_9HELO|nr:uncharacterized protein PAC_04656 [Phialocephala subalpina]
MDPASSTSPEAIETPQIMAQPEQESPPQHDASINLDAQTPTSSPESPEPEPTLPVLKPDTGKKVIKTEIPDSESDFLLSSPEKTIRADVGSRNTGTRDFVAAPDADAEDGDEESGGENQVTGESAGEEGGEVTDGDARLGDVATGSVQANEVESVVDSAVAIDAPSVSETEISKPEREEDNGAGVTSEATELKQTPTASEEAKEVGIAVDTAISINEASVPGPELSKPEEDGVSGVKILSGDTDSEELAAAPLQVNNAVDAAMIIDKTSVPDTDMSDLEEVPIEQAPVVLQEETVRVESLPILEEKVKEGAATIINTSLTRTVTDYSKFKVPELKKILHERGLAISGNKPDLIARLKEDDEKATDAAEVEDEALKENSSPVFPDELVEKLATLSERNGTQETEIPLLQADGEDVIMTDEALTQAEEPANSENLTFTVKVSENGEDRPILREKTSSAQRYSIPDSDDEEMSDAPSPAKQADDATSKTEAASMKPTFPTESVSAIQDDAEVSFSLTPTTAATKALELLPSSSQASEVAVEDSFKMPPPPSPSHSQNSALSSPVKIRVSPNPSFKVPSPVKKTQAQSSSAMMPFSPSKPEPSTSITPSEVADKGATSTATECQGSQKDGVMSELKALKMASIQARITSLQAEIATKRAKRDELQQGLIQPAAETVKRHIKLLHDYNDIKDIGQGLVGMIADQRGLRVGELYEEFGVDLKD